MNNKKQIELNELKDKIEKLLTEAFDLLDNEVIDDCENYNEVLGLKNEMDNLIRNLQDTDFIEIPEENEELDAWKEDGMVK